ncbi:PH domain-containing protein [Halobacillus yeomjeoni]|uniref:PH domain-containing protein n=1 Tax=Halobacillus yeomjeoni TaxID=311194 RepID=UPI001CD7AB31|nr:PH domain-containing protein [Halobacillus yeomjeoni]MCA0983977.1 PH domain-containing protein [Halobacillus yeomjeoni]
MKSLKDAIFPLIIVFLFNGNMFRGDVEWIPLLIWAGALLLILSFGVIRWLRFRYWLEDGELRIEYGLIFRKKRYIPIDRIQSLNFSEGIFHRPFQLVKVTVETAGSTGNQQAEAELTAISRMEADQLEGLIFDVKNHGKGTEAGEDEAPQQPERTKVFEMRNKDLVLMAVTSGGAGVVLSGVGFFFSQILDILPVGVIYEEVLNWIKIGVLVVAAAIFVIVLVAYGISILLTMLRYARFTVLLDGEDLVITRGWLEKKQMTIPLNRIQGIRIDENWIRQPLGYASVTLISAGGSIQKEAEQQLRLLPMIKKTEIPHVLKNVLKDYKIDVEYNRLPARAKIRYMIRSSWFAWAACIPVSYFFYPYGLLSIFAALGFTGIGWLSYRDAGWNLSGQQLSLKSRSFIKQTFIMKKYRIQSTYLNQSVLQRRAHLKSLLVALKSGAGTVVAPCLYMDQKDAEHILNWYRPYS